MTETCAPSSPPYHHRILISVVAEPSRQFGVDDGVPEEFATCRKAWQKAVSGKNSSAAATELERIRAMLERRLIFGFVPTNLKEGTTLLVANEFLVRGLTVLGFDFSQGILPSVRAEIVIDLPFAVPIPLGGIGDWQDENDRLDWACALHLDFEYEVEFGEPIFVEEFEIEGPLAPDDPGTTCFERIAAKSDAV